MSTDYPTDQDTPTVALLCECAAAPVEINQGLLSDGLLFATHNARGRYISTVTARKPQWLKDNPDKWQSVRNIQEPTVQLGAPLKDKNNVGTAPSWLMGQTSSRDGHEPTSLPTPVTTIVENGTPKAELPRRAEADASEVEAPKTETTPLGGTDRKRGRQIKKQKLEAEVAKAGGMLSPERMRIVLDSLLEYPILSHAARKAGIHRKTLPYWLKRSEAGDAGYDIEWQGEIWRFHEHCESAIGEAHDQLRAVAWDIAMGGVIYKIDQSLVDLGCEGSDAYLRDQNGNPVVETIRKPNGKMLRFVLEWERSEIYGKHRKIDIPRNSGVLVVGGIRHDTPNKVNNCAASVKARKWKSLSRMIQKTKA